ncbi:hypothetical protein EYF80_052320 [Liparis tanakae]|uniref:Uncharacterized protein n=1 Tax=Liparis tanakae TaxID=230148 RepID=A0A4Z2FAV4_9TELE|nr:hypothetical protein EYF80_052320 [Liparis tanakae]
MAPQDARTDGQTDDGIERYDIQTSQSQLQNSPPNNAERANPAARETHVAPHPRSAMLSGCGGGGGQMAPWSSRRTHKTGSTYGVRSEPVVIRLKSSLGLDRRDRVPDGNMQTGSAAT